MSKQKNVKSIIESILLVADKPVSAKELSICTEVMIADVQKALLELLNDFENRGMRIIKKGDYYSLVTAPENAEAVGKYLNEELRHDLSDAALETLSIVTYKQPITRVEIEEIRGVNSDQIVRNLMIRGLIAEVGRKDSPGRPILYGTTMEFLQFFGLNNDEEIPVFEVEIEKQEVVPELFQEVDSIVISK